MTISNLALEHPDITTDGDLVAAWLDGRPLTTKRTYSRNVAEFMAATTKLLRDVTPTDIHSFARGMDGKPATISTKISTVKSLLNFGFRVGYLATNAGAAIVVGGTRPNPRPGLSVQDVQRLIDAARSDRDRALIRLLYFSGCRTAAASMLSHDDIGTAAVKLSGKLGKRLVVPIPEELCEELRSLVRGTSPDAPVFVTCHGNRMSPRAIRYAVEQLGQRGLRRGVNPRMLRHAHATHALEAGAPAHHVQRCLGHATLQTTSFYVDATPGANSAKYLDV